MERSHIHIYQSGKVRVPPSALLQTPGEEEEEEEEEDSPCTAGEMHLDALLFTSLLLLFRFSQLFHSFHCFPSGSLTLGVVT